MKRSIDDLIEGALHDPEKESDKYHFIFEDADKIFNGKSQANPQIYLRLRKLHAQRRKRLELLEATEKYVSGAIILNSDGSPQVKKAQVDSDDDIFRLRENQAEARRRVSEAFSYSMAVAMILRQATDDEEENEDYL